MMLEVQWLVLIMSNHEYYLSEHKKKKMHHWRKIADHKYAEKGICMMQ